jgi:porphobilinogen synthase
MPGVFRWPVNGAVELCRKAEAAGIPAVLLFGITGAKDEEGSASWNDDNVVAQSVCAIKREVPCLCVMTDVCLCGYTSHGHCGVLREGKIDNDATLDRLSRVALCHARAGADFVAPSDMMDGRVGHIRAALDAHGFADTGILSYAVKYASAFYGPFRDAAGSAPAFGDRRTHQMNPANAREAVREAVADAAEGADMVMVKPALAYLDVIRRIREAINLPVAAYNVSGEYAMVKAASSAGWIDEKAVVLESLTGMARAGANIIITYHALDAAAWIGEAT